MLLRGPSELWPERPDCGHLAGQPRADWLGLAPRMLSRQDLLARGADFTARILAAGVPRYRGATLTRIERQERALRVAIGSVEPRRRHQ
jgi:hypothetical protein